jgi:hypothetical protein
MTDEAQTTVAILDKNRDEELRILLGTFRGHRLCHVRTFLKRMDGVERDTPLPTKKGVTFKTEQLPELIAALQQACSIEGIGNAA